MPLPSSKCMMLIVDCWCISGCIPALYSHIPPSIMPPETQGLTLVLCDIFYICSDGTANGFLRSVIFYIREKLTRVLLAQADELQEVSGAYEGSIAVAMGLKHVSCPALLVAIIQSVPSVTDLHTSGYHTKCAFCYRPTRETLLCSLLL